MCAGGTATANSDPREGVRSGQLQHDVKEYVRGHVSGDVVGLSRERIKAGITDARKRGKAHGRPRAKANDAAQIRTLAQQGLSQAAIARHSVAERLTKASAWYPWH